MNIQVIPMTHNDASAIITWQYPHPYEIYTMNNDDSALESLLLPDNQYYAIHNADDDCIGFCCFGKEGQVPNGDYQQPALDVGIGLHPDWIGKGYGAKIFADILIFAHQHFQPPLFRATVAKFNQRSLKMCLKNGFEAVSEFESRSGMPFTILTRLP